MNAMMPTEPTIGIEMPQIGNSRLFWKNVFSTFFSGNSWLSAGGRISPLTATWPSLSIATVAWPVRKSAIWKARLPSPESSPSALYCTLTWPDSRSEV